jgi:hypothetical protein
VRADYQDTARDTGIETILGNNANAFRGQGGHGSGIVNQGAKSEYRAGGITGRGRAGKVYRAPYTRAEPENPGADNYHAYDDTHSPIPMQLEPTQGFLSRLLPELAGFAKGALYSSLPRG